MINAGFAAAPQPLYGDMTAFQVAGRLDSVAEMIARLEPARSSLATDDMGTSPIEVAMGAAKLLTHRHLTELEMLDVDDALLGSSSTLVSRMR